MILKRIKLENYRRFSGLELEFPENIIGMIGRNGVGKSSLIEAVGWALYGTVVARTSKQEMRSQFCAASDVCRVELDFVYGDQEYRIERKIKGKNAIAEAALYRSGSPVPEAVQERGVNEYMENLLKLDYRSFLVSVFARQKELATLSTMQPEERRRSINRLIGIEEIDSSRERVRKDRNDQAKYLEGVRHHLADMGALQTRKQVLDDLLTGREAEMARCTNAVQQQQAKLTALKIDFESWSGVRDQFNNFTSRMIKLNTRLQEGEANAERLRNELTAVAVAEKELAALAPKLAEVERIKTLKEEQDRLALAHARHELLQQTWDRLARQWQTILDREQSLRTALDENPDLDKQVQDSSARMIALEKTIPQARDRQIHWSGRRNTAEHNGREWSEKLKTLQHLGPHGVCPTCTQPLQDHYQQAIAEIEEKIDSLRQEFKTSRQQETELTKHIEKQEQELADLRKQKERLLQIRAGLEEKRKQLQQLLFEKQSVEQQRRQNDQDLAELGAVAYRLQEHRHWQQQYEQTQTWLQKSAQLQERAGRRSSLQEGLTLCLTTINEINSDLQETQKARAALGFQEEIFQKAKQDIEQESRMMDERRDNLSDCRAALAGVKQELAAVNEAIRDQLVKIEQIKKLEEELLYLDSLDMHLGRFRLALAGRIRPLLAHRASELLSLTTNHRYQKLALDEDYNISVFDNNFSFGVNRYSGGEQDLINLCLRIAISRVVAERCGGHPINFIVLDEVFGSQDDERKQAILEALAQLSTQFRQIFMITHVESIKETLPVILEVRQLDEERSEAAWL